MEFYNWKIHWSNGFFCDFNCIVNVYKQYEINKTHMNRHKLKQWARENMLNYSRLVEMDKLVEKLVSILTEKKFITKEIENSDIDFDTNHTYQSIAAASEQEAIDECYIIKFMVSGAFYPNYFQTTEINQDDIIRKLASRDAKTTVAVNSFFIIIFKE